VQRLRAEDFAALCDARQLIASAREEARAIVEGAEAVREQARREGLEQGRREAQLEATEAVAGMRANLSRWVLETEPRLIELVSRCVADVVRGVDADTLVRASVERALIELAAAPDVRIKVHESQVPMLRERMAELAARLDLRGVLRVEALASLQPGDCIVETPLGLLDLRIGVQLAFVDRALSTAG
jgi:type III secretion protein L